MKPAAAEKHYDLHSPSQHKTRMALIWLTALALIFFVLTISYGEYSIDAVSLIRCLLHVRVSDPNVKWVIFTLRMPRVLIAWMVGAGLAISGAILQALTRNPLVEPGILGTNGGASIAAVTVIVFWPAANIFVLPLAAFGGALASLALLYLVVLRRHPSTAQLLLAGIALSALLSAATNMLLTYAHGLSLEQVFFWFAGSISAKSWPQLWPVASLLLLLVPLSLAMASSLNVLEIGDSFAVSLGIRLGRQRCLLLLIAAALAGVCVATAGPISFVGMMAPNAARRLVGAWQQRIIPVAAMIGGVLVASADLAGRAVSRTSEIPCGLVTAIFGGIYLYFLLAHTSRRGTLR
jgi:iron complex transport system permease protein